MKNIKLILTDLDGTILEHGKLIGNKDKETLIKAQKMGIKVAIATGQSWSQASKTAKELELDKNTNLLICNNGSILANVDKFNIIKAEYLNEDLVKEIVDFSNKFESCIYVFRKKELQAFHNGVKNYSQNLNKINWDGAFDLTLIDKNTKYEDILQIMVFPKPQFTDEFKKSSLEIFGSRTNICPNDGEDVMFFEFNSKEASKGKGLNNLLETLNLTKDDVIVFGDNQNDISMFKEAKYSVAVNNAHDLLKQIATNTTLSNLENGVSDFIEKNILN